MMVAFTSLTALMKQMCPKRPCRPRSAEQARPARGRQGLRAAVESSLDDGPTQRASGSYGSVSLRYLGLKRPLSQDCPMKGAHSEGTEQLKVLQSRNSHRLFCRRWEQTMGVHWGLGGKAAGHQVPNPCKRTPSWVKPTYQKTLLSFKSPSVYHAGTWVAATVTYKAFSKAALHLKMLQSCL